MNTPSGKVCPTGARLTKIDNNNIYEEEVFYLTTHSTHFIYGYMASDLW